MKMSRLKIAVIGLSFLGLAGCTTGAERLGGAGSGAIVGAAVGGPAGLVVGGVGGAIVGPSVAYRMGIPHRGPYRHYHHWRRHHRYYPW